MVAYTVPARHRYDRQKLTLKDVHNCQYVACMNPTSGSFTIDPRLQVNREVNQSRQLLQAEAALALACGS